MKRAITFILTVIMIASAFSLSVSAAENKIVWSEDFSKVTTFEQLNWPLITVLKPTNTTVYTIENGRLLVDNPVDDTYAVMVPESVMKDVVKDDYTVQYTLEYVSAGKHDRYLAVLLNYDRVMGNNYNSLHIRMRGDGNWQNRFLGTWSHMEALKDTEVNAMTNQNENAFIKKVFGTDIDMTSATALAGKKMVVRQEVHVSKKKVDIYVNDVLVSTTTEMGWDYFDLCKDYSEIALKAGGIIKAYIDDIYVATGIGIPASATVTTEAATTAAPGVTEIVTGPSSEPTTTTPPTSDSMTIMLIATVMITAAGALIIFRKKASNKA